MHSTVSRNYSVGKGERIRLGCSSRRLYVFRACPKIPKGPVFAEKTEWRGATKENIPSGSSTEEQRSQAAFSAKTLRAAGLLTLWNFRTRS